ncbi:response regulator [Rhizobium grahamii]|uniref:Response regulator receiver and SARP domain protein n=1 Tax=Rhizobium grahamii CCGE 502 TaxID=990285 RepID=S3IAE8_9HYPH|nr:response regulator [Rhizobium grahamii]EPE96248.1 response regulator receiver and SARP domain protein [Rhizobium grahamii CCGE 502]
MEKLANIGHVLVLEDEPFISLDMEEMLRELGAASVTVFDTRSDGLNWLASNRPDIAIVDPRLNDGVCTDVVELLASAQVPFVVYSGADVDEPVFRKGGWLGKPTMPETLRETVERLLP